MRLHLFNALMLLSFLGLAGCGGGEEDVQTYESYFAKIVAKADEITAEFKSMKDDQSAMVAVDNIMNKSNDLATLLGESSDLPKVGTSAGLQLKKRYEEHWKNELTRAFQRLRKEANAAQNRYGRHPAMLRISARMKNLRKQIDEFEKGFNEAMGIE